MQAAILVLVCAGAPAKGLFGAFREVNKHVDQEVSYEPDVNVRRRRFAEMKKRLQRVIAAEQQAFLVEAVWFWPVNAKRGSGGGVNCRKWGRDAD